MSAYRAAPFVERPIIRVERPAWYIIGWRHWILVVAPDATRGVADNAAALAIVNRLLSSIERPE